MVSKGKNACFLASALLPNSYRAYWAHMERTSSCISSLRLINVLPLALNCVMGFYKVHIAVFCCGVQLSHQVWQTGREGVGRYASIFPLFLRLKIMSEMFLKPITDIVLK